MRLLVAFHSEMRSLPVILCALPGAHTGSDPAANTSEQLSLE
jgi:hypothetical protein